MSCLTNALSRLAFNILFKLIRCQVKVISHSIHTLSIRYGPSMYLKDTTIKLTNTLSKLSCESIVCHFVFIHMYMHTHVMLHTLHSHPLQANTGGKADVIDAHRGMQVIWMVTSSPNLSNSL